MAVNKALEQKTPVKSLDDHLLEIFQAKYDLLGEPIDLQNKLHLPPEMWAFLYKDYLK